MPPEWPETCAEENCNAGAYHLSTVDAHFFGQVTDDGTCMWTETRKFKCRLGHISEVTVWKAKDVYEHMKWRK